MNKTDLSKFNNTRFNPGGNVFIRVVWYCINRAFFISYCPFNFVKIFFLKLFGARVGSNVLIKPAVNIKYPWNLVIGNNVWIGEKVWIDNLTKVSIGDNVCISQGAMLLTGNHNYKKSSFDLIVEEIQLEEGVWIGAKAIVCPGVKCKPYAVLSVGSVAVSELEAFGIYQGNPAVKVRERVIE